MHRHRAAWRHAPRVLALSSLALLGAMRAHAAADPDEGLAPLVRRLADRVDRSLLPRCLTPEVGGVMQELVAAGTLQALLPPDFTLLSGNVGAHQIALQIEDAAHHPYGVTLALPGAQSGTPDGQGRHFLYYLAPAASPTPAQATAALLAMASLIDDAVPDTALARCAGTEAPQPDGRPDAHADRRYPRILALASALAEVLVIAAAIAFGVWAIHPRGSASDEPS